MTAYVTALGTFAGQLTASFRRDTSETMHTAEAKSGRSFFGVLLSALAAWPG